MQQAVPVRLQNQLWDQRYRQRLKVRVSGWQARAGGRMLCANANQPNKQKRCNVVVQSVGKLYQKVGNNGRQVARVTGPTVHPGAAAEINPVHVRLTGGRVNQNARAVVSE